MTTLRGIAQLSNCLLTHMLLAYWRKLLVSLLETDWRYEDGDAESRHRYWLRRNTWAAVPGRYVRVCPDTGQPRRRVAHLWEHGGQEAQEAGRLHPQAPTGQDEEPVHSRRP